MNARILSFDLYYNDFVTIRTNASSLNNTFLIDTQADISIFKFGSINNANNISIDDSYNVHIRGITKNIITSLGCANLQLYFNNSIITHEFHIVPDEFNIDTDGIIGKDFLQH